ncbi:hypothetical protein DRN85_04440 [Methanosarcinales archaeon]|nr:MAG: hypothetical protein DRN85_04440 [Methanosarcinales archaeon]
MIDLYTTGLQAYSSVLLFINLSNVAILLSQKILTHYFNIFFNILLICSAAYFTVAYVDLRGDFNGIFYVFLERGIDALYE